jgi:hypothetical protein
MGYDNRVLRKIFGPRREKVTGGWRKKCIKMSFITSTFSLSILGMIKSRLMRWAAHKARMVVEYNSCSGGKVRTKRSRGKRKRRWIFVADEK